MYNIFGNTGHCEELNAPFSPGDFFWSGPFSPHNGLVSAHYGKANVRNDTAQHLPRLVLWVLRPTQWTSATPFFPPFAALWAISKAVGSSLTIALHTHANDERKRLGLYSRLAMLEGLPCWQQPPDTELEVPRTENVKEKEISAREGQKEPRIDDTANEQY